MILTNHILQAVDDYTPDSYNQICNDWDNFKPIKSDFSTMRLI